MKLFNVCLLIIFKIILKKSYHVFDYERWIVSRLGKETFVLGPGYVELLNENIVDKIAGKIDIRELCYEIPMQQVMTKDQVIIQVTGFLFMLE